MHTCTCELRDRKWNPNTERCEFCGGNIVAEARYTPLQRPTTGGVVFTDLLAPDDRGFCERVGQKAADDVAAIRALPNEAFTREVELEIARNRGELPKTWSIVADKAGTHWHATVRRGTEGSRALCGRLTFDLSDVAALGREIDDIAFKVVTHAVVATISELRKRDLLKTFVEPGQFSMHLGMIGDDVRKEVVPHARELVLEQFGIRVDLAKVGPDLLPAAAPARADQPWDAWPKRDIVLAEIVPADPYALAPGKRVDRWLVTLSCGHKKFVGTKQGSYHCLNCPKL